MMPFTRRIDPERARFLASTCRALALIAGVFCVAVATLLVANSVQLSTLKIQDNPALTALRESYRRAPENDALAAQIRALDLLARRAYFTRQWQIRTGAYLLVAGAAVLLACLRAVSSLEKAFPRPKPLMEEGAGKEPKAARRALAAAGVVLLAGAFASTALGLRFLNREPAASATAAGAGAPAAAPAASPAQVPELTTTEAYKTNWPQFRGPGGNGVASAQDPPVDWDGARGRNILWKSEVPLPGTGSPVVWGDRVFLSGADASRREIYCWEAATGRLLWRRAIERPPGSPAEPPQVGPDTGYAAPTMAVNGKAAFALFATGDLAAVDFAGNALWTRNLGSPEHPYGFSSSLALYGDSIIVQFDQTRNGRLMAIDAATGETHWDAPRVVSPSWASPVVVDTGARVEILVNANPILSAYDPRTGTQLWKVSGMMGDIGSSPAFAGGRVFAANQLLSLVAVDAGTGKTLWEMYDDLPDVASPVATDTLVFSATGYGVVTCLDAATGGVVWREQYATGFYSSPILVGDRIYLLDRTGVMRVLAASRAATLIASPALGEPAVATPAFRGGRIFIRGSRSLFCIGAPGG